VCDHSPYWEAFYGKIEEELTMEETIPAPPTQTSGMDITVREEAYDM